MEKNKQIIQAKKEMAKCAIAAAEKVLGRAIEKKDEERLIKETINSLDKNA